jgi:hypothetical protein
MKNFLKMHTLLLCLAITLFVQETKAQVDTSTTQNYYSTSSKILIKAKYPLVF